MHKVRYSLKLRFKNNTEQHTARITFWPNIVSIADAESNRDAEQGQHDHIPSGGGTLAFRDDKQETIVVRPYPQVQAHGQPQATPQSVPIQSGTPVTVAAPSVHLTQGQPAVLTDGQMKVMYFFIFFF